MQDKLERLNRLFSNLSEEQQEDVLNLLETWMKVKQSITEQSANMQSQSDPAPSDAAPTFYHPDLCEQWQCVNTLREMVREYFRPTVELAYIAFHPDLDSISTAKSRTAVERMFELEAAYELKSILETQPDSSIISKQMVEEFRKKRNSANSNPAAQS
jgi:hypothetical protein